MRVQNLYFAFFLFLIFAIPFSGIGQNNNKTTFDSTGKLTFLSLKPVKNSLPFFVAKYKKADKNGSKKIFEAGYVTSTQNTILRELKKYDESQITSFRKILSDCVEATTKAMNNPDLNLRSFLDTLWGKNESIKYINELNSLKRYLDSSGKLDLNNTPFYTSFLPVLTSTLFNDVPISYYFGDTSMNKMELWRKNMFNEFVIGFYNNSFSAAPDWLKKLTINEININTRRLEYFSKKADSLLLLVYNNNGEMKVEHLNAMQDFIKELGSADPGFRLENRVRTYEQMTNTFKAPWFKQWLWYNKGELRINPLGFTKAEFYVSVDKNKELINMSNRYVDTMLARHLRYDTAANLIRYDQLLLQKGKAKERINTSEVVEKLRKENKDNMNALLNTKMLLNRVEIPEKGMFLNYSASKDFNCSEDEKVVKKYKEISLHGADAKQIAIHNIPRGYLGKLLEEDKKISLESSFQSGFGQFLNYATQVMSFVPSFAPFAGLIESNKVNVPNYINRNANDSTSKTEKSYAQILKDHLKLNGLFNQKAFDLFENKNQIQESGINIETKIKESSISKDQIKFINKLISFYEYVLSLLKANVWNTVRKDSMLLKGMYDVFSNASLLPDSLITTKDDNPLFFTSILKTSPSEDSSIERKVAPIVFAKDTIKLASFKYKMGKSIRWGLGAGIGYTTTNFTQSKAKEENGQIKIENTSQSFRFVVGIQYYFGKGLYVHDNRFGGRFAERLSFYLGVGIPKPLENIYSGLAYDFVPGLKLATGLHFYRNDTYTIVNNIISDKKLRYRPTLPFFAILIDPNNFLKTLEIINKN